MSTTPINTEDPLAYSWPLAEENWNVVQELATGGQALIDSLDALGVYVGPESVSNRVVDTTLVSYFVAGGAAGGYFGGANTVGQSWIANASPVAGPAWTADTYVAGRAEYSTVFGYDNFINGLSAIVLGNHNHIFNAVAHSFVGSTLSQVRNGDYTFIGGGSSHIVNLDPLATGGGNVFIGNGDTNTITGTGATGGVFNAMVNGHASTMSGTGNYSFMGTGFTNTISATGDSNTIINGQTQTIGGTSFRSVIGSGDTSTITSCNWGFLGAVRNCQATSADYAFIGGARDSTITAFNGAIPSGESCSVSVKYALAQGKGVKATTQGSLNYSARFNVAAGDAQGSTFNCSRVTTDATADTALYIDGTAFAIPPTGSCWVGKVYVAGTTGTLVCGFEIPFVAQNVAGTITVRKGGVAGDIVTLYDGIGVAAVPTVGGGGQFYVGVTGKAATTIRWSATVVMTQVI